ncbi:hypothetical protein S83_065989 [Arachis hypogaea]
MPSNPASGEESDEKQSFSSKNKFSSRNSSSKYDFVKVKVRLGDNADHYYILFRFLLSRMLTVTNIPNHVAIKIALELKKLLIDNSLLDVYELFGNYFSGWIPEWIGQKKNLRFLDFSQNLFYETIPSNLGGSAKISGQIPPLVANLTGNNFLCTSPSEHCMDISKPLNGLAKGVAIGISIAGTSGVLPLLICACVRYFQKKEEEKIKLPTEDFISSSTQDASSSGEYETSGSTAASASGLLAIMAAKSVEFSYQELSKATNNFSSDNKTGQGGFGAVYFAELRGQKAAIKKMDVQASTEFLSELKVLTHIHHLNLVTTFFYTQKVEFLWHSVNLNLTLNNLGQYLHGTGREPLAWSTKVQIALDSARGLEYIHEHTVLVYIHNEMKPANILIYKNFRGKVADFGLTKLREVRSSLLLHTRLVGTFETFM